MKLGTLIVIPFGWTGLYLLVALGLYGHPGGNETLRLVESPLSNIMMLTGCFLAILKFEPGDYLRRAWLLFAVTPFLFLFFDLGQFLRQWMSTWSFEIEVSQGVLAIVANFSSIAGVYMFASAWKVAELSLPGSDWLRWFTCLMATVLALMIVGPGIVTSIQNVFMGEKLGMSLMGIGSSFGDIVSLALLAPLVLTAVMLRGGILSWPWIFVTSSTVCWLAFDFAVTLATPMGFDPRTVDVFYGVTQCLASGFAFSAGMAQRFVAIKILKESKL